VQALLRRRMRSGSGTVLPLNSALGGALDILVIKRSRWKIILALSLEAFFIITSTVAIIYPLGLDRIRPIISGVLFLVLFVWTFPRLFDKTPVLAMSDEGIKLRHGTILWAEISDVRKTSRGDFVVRIRSDDSKLKERLLPLKAGDMDPNEAFQIISHQVSMRCKGAT